MNSIQYMYVPNPNVYILSNCTHTYIHVCICLLYIVYTVYALTYLKGTNAPIDQMKENVRMLSTWI